MHTAFPLHKVTSTTCVCGIPEDGTGPICFPAKMVFRGTGPLPWEITNTCAVTDTCTFVLEALFIHPWLLMKKKRKKRKVCGKQIFFLLWGDHMSRWLFPGTHVVNGGIKRFITDDIDCLSGPQLCSCHKRTQVQFHYNAFSVDEGKMLRRKKTFINS